MNLPWRRISNNLSGYSSIKERSKTSHSSVGSTECFPSKVGRVKRQNIKEWPYIGASWAPKTHNQTQDLRAVMRKTSDKSEWSKKHLTSTPQNCKHPQNQGKSEKLSQPRESEGDIMTKYHGKSWMGSKTHKRTSGKN